jgi:hypothetical protein
MAMESNLVKFPFAASRRAFARKSRARHEAPAPVGQKAQPAADRRARKAVEAMKGFLTTPE